MLNEILKLIFAELAKNKIFRLMYRGHWSYYQEIIYRLDSKYPIIYKMEWVPYKIKPIKTRIYHDLFCKETFIQTYQLLKKEKY
jgi:hypothetical protein